ncbi:hypothetical protein ABPG74_013892 [Tetrahymena malaccensis]
MFKYSNQEYQKKTLATGDIDPYNYNRAAAGDGFSQNQSYNHLPTQGNLHNQSVQYATSNAYFCEEHNDPVTNYCANLDCLRPLCPDCIDAHYKYHLQSSTIPQIESIKNMKINCSKKVDAAIQSLQKEMNDCELKYLIDPEQIINEGVAKINHTKEKVLLMVRKFFEMQEEIYIKRVNENLLRSGDFTSIFEKINTLINELDQLRYSLEGNSFLSSINRICRLDLISLRDKFKSDIHKIVQQRDLEPVQVLIDDQKVMQIKQDLDQTVIMAKQSDQQNRFNNQQNILAKQSNVFQQVNDIHNQSYRIANDLAGISPLKGTNSNFHSTAPPLAGKGPRETIEIHIADYFDESCKRKNLHFFIYDSDNKSCKLIYLDLNGNKQFQIINIDVDFPLPAFHKSIALPDGEIYLIGGTKPDKTKSNAIYRYDATNKKLVKESEGMKEGRSSFGVCILRNCIYVIGGIGNNGQYLSSCERYNLKTKKWETVSQINQASASFSCTSFNNRFIYKFGGNREDKSLLRTIEKYDVMQNKWYIINIQNQNNVPQFLTNSSCVQINQNEIFVFGGYDDQNSPSNSSYILQIVEAKDPSQSGAITKEENYVYTIQKINAQPLPIPEGFTNPQSIILNNTIFAIQDFPSNNSNELDDNKRQILQFNGKQWTLIRDL